MVKITIRIPLHRLKRGFRRLKAAVYAFYPPAARFSLKPVRSMRRGEKATVTIRGPLYRLKRFFRENLGAPFIIFFQTMLLTCAVLLVHGNPALADEVAVYAYYSLVIGVILQLIHFIRRKGSE